MEWIAAVVSKAILVSSEPHRCDKTHTGMPLR